MVSSNFTIPSDYFADHLFLLVGTNPLPNFVAAKLLMTPGGQLYLVHSTATQPIAERMARYWIDEEKGQAPRYVYVQEADGADIRRNIESELRKIPKGDQIGLHFTGGTKIMSVHACRTMLDYQENERRPVVLSYLDARSNCVHIEYSNNAPFVSDSILYQVHLPPTWNEIVEMHKAVADKNSAADVPPPFLERVVQMHAVKLVSKIERTPLLPDMANQLALTHQSVDACIAWRSWCDNTLRPRARTKKDSEWDTERILRSVRVPLPTDESLSTFAAQLQARFGVEQEMVSLETIRQQEDLPKIKHLCEWLDGKWLEYHILNTIRQIAETRPQCKIYDFGMGVKPKNETDSPEYDVDIGVMQGYRLYAISCTTDDDKGMCKLKLFEAFERARNMGGDEAHVGLICMNDSPSTLEKQVGRSWDATGKVRVFGRPDLSDLSNKLAEWFISAGS
jgi:hypothetical protein